MRSPSALKSSALGECVQQGACWEVEDHLASTKILVKALPLLLVPGRVFHSGTKEEKVFELLIQFDRMEVENGLLPFF